MHLGHEVREMRLCAEQLDSSRIPSNLTTNVQIVKQDILKEAYR